MLKPLVMTAELWEKLLEQTEVREDLPLTNNLPCRFWTGYQLCTQADADAGRSGGPYGSFYGHRVHRVSYKYNHHDIPSTVLVRHICNRTLCVEPQHLLSGTPKDNAEDAMNAGTLKGRDPGGGAYSKLNWQKVAEIRHLLATTDLTQRAIAELFGVKQRLINNINTGKRWNEARRPKEALVAA